MGLMVAAGLDVMRTPDAKLRHLGQAGWLGVVMFVPVIGPALWFVIGRPAGDFHPLGPAGSGGPDDDEAFMRYIRARADEERRRNHTERRRDADPTAEPPSAAA